jgi:hypothetical protein
MLDALKFAFEIMVVAALALPWLALLNRMFPFNPASGLRLDFSFVPKGAQDAVTVTFIVALGYLLGSAVSRISRNFFDDQHVRIIPTEHKIRNEVYREVYCKGHLVSEMYLPFAGSETLKRQAFQLCLQADNESQFGSRVETMFRLQEGKVLLLGEDKVERLKQYYDQITVLRGAAFNAFVLFSLCAFGVCGNLRARWSGRRVARFLAFLPAGMTILLGSYVLFLHWFDAKSLYSSPPLPELIFILLSMVGFLVISKAETASYLGMCGVAAIVTLACCGGWWWTEVMYDLQVIHFQPTLQ